MNTRSIPPPDPDDGSPVAGFAAGRLFTVRETAQILGLCHDSVRHHLRSGQLQGVRVGGTWRVPEQVLLAKLGLTTPALAAPLSVAMDQTAPLSSHSASDSESKAKEASALQMEMVQELVQQAAAHADLSRRATQRLLAELDDLLQARMGQK